MTTAAREFKRLVAGEWRGSTTPPLEVLNPAELGTVVGTVPAMTASEVAEAYDAAEVGARIWRRTTPIARGQVMSRAADLLRDRSGPIAADLVAEMGKTLAEATVEVTKAADFLDYYAGLARLPQGSLLSDARPDTHVHTRHEPVGIVCLITPWNDPLLTPARKLSPALLAGNAVLLKPASETPLVAVHLARALRRRRASAGGARPGDRPDHRDHARTPGRRAAGRPVLHGQYRCGPLPPVSTRGTPGAGPDRDGRQERLGGPR